MIAGQSIRYGDNIYVGQSVYNGYNLFIGQRWVAGLEWGIVKSAGQYNMGLSHSKVCVHSESRGLGHIFVSRSSRLSGWDGHGKSQKVGVK